MKYWTLLALILVSCTVTPVFEFQQPQQISLLGIDFPKDDFAVSVHSPSKQCRQLGMLELESIAGGRLVHEVRTSVPYGSSEAVAPTYFTVENNFHPTALRGSSWEISERNDVQECLDSLVGAAKTMGGNVLADFEIRRTTYQVVWGAKDKHLIVREADLFLPKDKFYGKVQDLPVVVVKGLVCVCDSMFVQ